MGLTRQMTPQQAQAWADPWTDGETTKLAQPCIHPGGWAVALSLNK